MSQIRKVRIPQCGMSEFHNIGIYEHWNSEMSKLQNSEMSEYRNFRMSEFRNPRNSKSGTHFGLLNTPLSHLHFPNTVFETVPLTYSVVLFVLFTFPFLRKQHQFIKTTHYNRMDTFVPLIMFVLNYLGTSVIFFPLRKNKINYQKGVYI